MINGSSRRDLLLNSQNFCRSIPTGAENPSLSRLCYRRLWGSRNRRALILGSASGIDQLKLNGVSKRPGRNMAFKLSSELVDASKGSGDAIRAIVDLVPIDFEKFLEKGQMDRTFQRDSAFSTLSKWNLFQTYIPWNPILTKDSCGFGGSSYRRTGNGEFSPPFRPTLWS
ncbi:hypothetical protein L6164_037911 [Bauhinia variegata]|nr:hypothetical protein L6164_037911 [Bauhinia variegata]